jgi:hypothetical protein
VSWHTQLNEETMVVGRRESGFLMTQLYNGFRKEDNIFVGGVNDLGAMTSQKNERVSISCDFGELFLFNMMKGLVIPILWITKEMMSRGPQVADMECRETT